ncbi:MAG: coproporphyrinogen dehydrogenase HemZ [Lachnospiraceae bacterium]|nr:coproporphyrinogen dehydrogenase HemZ [Lachnospiraceae bacterium]
MMKVFLNSPGFSYDVHSLVKAFYPAKDVKIELFEEGLPKGEFCVYVSSGDAKRDQFSSGTVRISAPYTNGDISEEEDYDLLSRAELKNLVKRALYRVLCRLTGKELPWGTMTGIRPVKVPMKLYRQGANDNKIAEYMKSVYLCSDEKIALATDIAKKEAGIIDRISDNGFSLYIGIPFCPTTCMYCSFTSYPIVSWEKRTDEYIAVLKRELDMFAGYYEKRCPDSIYIGGGTPTTLSPKQLGDIISYVAKRFDLSKLLEFTVEAGRPDSITKEKLGVLKSSGVGRISINPQTMNEKTLRLIGRRHSVEDVYKAFDLAREAGFTNINTDLILGLPGEDENDVSNTFDKIKQLAPDSITVHSLAIKRAAAMNSFLSEHDDIISQNTPKMMETARRCAESLGMEPYYLYRQKNMSGNFENVGYAKPGCFGIYNIVIMEEVSDIAAAGAGTISKRVFASDRIERTDNVKDVALYIDRIEEMIDKKKKLFCKGET